MERKLTAHSSTAPPFLDSTIDIQQHTMVSSMPDETIPPEEVVTAKEKDRTAKTTKRKRRHRRRVVRFDMDDNDTPLCTEYSYPGALYNAKYDDLFWGDEEMENMQEETAVFIEEIRNRGETEYTEALEGLIVSELEDPENLHMSKIVTRSPTRGFESYFSPIILKLQKACVDEVLEAQRQMSYAQSSSERKERERKLAKVSKKWSHELRMFAHKKALGDFMLAMKIHKENREHRKRESKSGRKKVRPSREQNYLKESQHSTCSANSNTKKSEKEHLSIPKPPPSAKSPRTPSNARKSPRGDRKSSSREQAAKSSPQTSSSNRKSTKEAPSSRESRGLSKESGHSMSSSQLPIASSSSSKGYKSRKPVTSS
jgi:hypothetical protein